MRHPSIVRYAARLAGAAGLSATAAFAPSQRAGAQGVQVPPPAGEVRASGVATVGIEPDLAIVTIQFSASGKTPAIAAQAAADRAAAIRKAIESVGIPRDSMPTKGRAGWWGVGNRSEMQFRREMRDTVYVTNDVFSVRVRDFELIGRIIDTAIVQGAQTISNVEFQATNDSPARLKAIREATIQARANANAIAEASGLRMGRAIELSTEVQPQMMARQEAFLMASARSADIGTQVVPPELKVTVSVQGRWEVVPQ